MSEGLLDDPAGDYVPAAGHPLEDVRVIAVEQL